MATALLIEFDPDNFDEHLRSWAAWRINSGKEDGLGSALSGMPKIGFYKGGKENILRQKPYTARGKPSRAGASHYAPEGRDTDAAIDRAVTRLERQYPESAEVLKAHFMSRGGRADKAAYMELSLPLYKLRLSTAKTFILGFMEGTKLRRAVPAQN